MPQRLETYVEETVKTSRMIADSELFGDLGLSFQREVGLVFRFFDGLGFITFYQAVLAACSNWGLARHCL